LVSDWEIEAHNWVRWARTPGHDEYWRYREVFFGALVPPPGRRALEIGSGEGRVARDLTARGHWVVGLDSSPTLARFAQEAATGASYLLADAAALPFRDDSFDLVVSYNSLMDVEDMPAAVSEAARVLTRSGRFCIGVSHPFADTGEFVREGPDARFIMTRPYFGRHRFEGTAERDGLNMTFRGWTHSLEDYAMALESAGLVIELLREPRPARLSAGDDSELPLPMFLYLRAMKPSS
jgi:SAM-dependent methyltransferase